MLFVTFKTLNEKRKGEILKMKAKIIPFILAMTVLAMTAMGCSDTSTETPAVQDEESTAAVSAEAETSETAIESTDSATKENTTEAASDDKDSVAKPLATITCTWDTSEVNLTEFDPETPLEGGAFADLVISGGGANLEVGKLYEQRDGDQVLFDSLITEEGNTKKYTCNIYSWDCGDMDFQAEPCAPINSFPDVDVVITQEGKADIHKTGEDLMIYSYTGTHFYGLCSVRNGEVVDWVIPEWLTEGMKNVER